MKALLQSLSGKKTYILSLVLALAGAVYWADATLHDDLATPDVVETTWFSVAQYQAFAAILGGGGLAALRSGVKKAEV